MLRTTAERPDPHPLGIVGMAFLKRPIATSARRADNRQAAANRSYGLRTAALPVSNAFERPMTVIRAFVSPCRFVAASPGSSSEASDRGVSASPGAILRTSPH